MDVAPCCYKGMDGMGLGWVSLGGVRYFQLFHCPSFISCPWPIYL